MQGNEGFVDGRGTWGLHQAKRRHGEARNEIGGESGECCRSRETIESEVAMERGNEKQKQGR